MTRPKGTGGKAKSLTRDEIARLRRSLKTTTHERRNRALIDLALGTGMRIGEIVSLVVKDVWDAQRHESLEEIVLERHSTKSGKSRTVAVAPFARYSIQQYLDERQQTGILYINMLLFPSYHSIHQPMTPNGAVNVVRRLFKRASIPNASSHSFRRTHADMLRRMGVDLHIIQTQLGHSSLAMTEKYFAVDPAEIRNAINKLEV